VNDVELNSKLRIGEIEDFAVRNVVHKDQTRDNTKKDISTMKQQNKKGLQQSRETTKVCSERNIMKKLRSKCLKAVNIPIIMLMVDIVGKLKQHNVKFVEWNRL